MADSPEDAGSPEAASFIGDLYSQAGAALKQGSDYVYAHTPEPVKDGVANLYSAVLGDGTSPQPDSAPPSQAAPTDTELAHAALICGYTAKDAPRQMTDAELARHHGVSPNSSPPAPMLSTGAG